MKAFTLIANDQQFYLHVVVVQVAAAHDLLGVLLIIFGILDEDSELLARRIR